MIFTIGDVKKALNKSVFEANLSPYKMPEHDSPLNLVDDYLTVSIRTYLKCLREKGHNNPREFN